MKRIGNITKLFALLLLLAVLTLGVAYGQWTDQLNVNGTVQTGELDVNFSDYRCSDDEGLATISAAYDPTDSDILHVTVGNGYPGYMGYCSIDYKVEGTIPVYIKAIDFSHDTSLTGCGFTTYNPSTGTFIATCDQMEVKWTNGLGTCFNVGEGEGSNLQVKVLPGSEPATSYGFTVVYTFEQGCP